MATPSPFQDLANQFADLYKIPRAIFNSLIVQESGFNPNSYSPKGAIGLTQLMPGTAIELGVNAWDTTDNLRGGAMYLAQQYAATGNWFTALQRYNGGPNLSLSNAQTASYAQSVLTRAGTLNLSNPASPMQSQAGLQTINPMSLITTTTPGGTSGAANPFDNAGAAPSPYNNFGTWWTKLFGSPLGLDKVMAPVPVGTPNGTQVAGGTLNDAQAGLGNPINNALTYAVSKIGVANLVGIAIVAGLILVAVSSLRGGGKSTIVIQKEAIT